MPKIEKQSAVPSKPSAPKASSATQTSNHRPPSGDGELLGIKLNVYGRGKTGKTRMACSFPKPLLLLGTEDGTKSICTAKRDKNRLPCGAIIEQLFLQGKAIGVDFVHVTDAEWIGDMSALIKAGGYKSVVLDHGGALQDLVLMKQLGLSELPIQRDWGMGDQQSWGAVGMQTKQWFRCLLDLADQDGVNVIIIAHERNFKEEGRVSDVMMPSVGAALTPSVAGWLNGACDYICQTFIRQREEVRKSEQNGVEVEIRVPTGGVEYCLRIGQHPIYMTGFRVPDGVELPDVIVDANFKKIAKLIHGE